MAASDNVSPAQFRMSPEEIRAKLNRPHFMLRRNEYNSARDAAAWGEGPSVDYDEAIEKDRSR